MGINFAGPIHYSRFARRINKRSLTILELLGHVGPYAFFAIRIIIIPGIRATGSNDIDLYFSVNSADLFEFLFQKPIAHTFVIPTGQADQFIPVGRNQR